MFREYVIGVGRRLAAPLLGFPGTELTGTTVAENLRDSALQAETLIALNKSVDFDIIFPMMDLTVETEALGGRVSWDTDEMPTIRGISVESREDAESLVIPEIGECNRLNISVETCTALRKAFPDKLLWAYVLGPFSIAGRLMGMTEVSIAVKLEPDTVHSVLNKANALLKKQINALIDTGVDGVMILEPASGMLREDDANEFSNAYIRGLVDVIKQRGKTPSLHNCGNIGHLIESLCDTGIEVLHVGSVSSPSEIYPRIPKDVVLMGNLDPTEFFLRATPEKVRRETTALLDTMADCDRFIISSGCDIPPGTSIENIKAFERAARSVAIPAACP
jgi:uroporphyrinogen decarboxylase